MASLHVVVALCVAVTVLAYVTSLITRNTSQVDRLWSILPGLYAAVFAGWTPMRFQNPRTTLMAVLIIAWGIRLTLNFARKGGYRAGSEDYRWPVLRKRMSPFVFHLFNIGFISIFQNVLLVLISLPVFIAGQNAQAPLNAVDVIAALVFVVALAGETIADNQQWRFHEAKRLARERGETVNPPFLTTGLFRFSRHPNFFCEQLMWWCVFAFSVAAAGTAWHIGLIGPVVLTALFQGSARFTEELSLEKYPSYAEYQRSTPRQFPLPRRQAGQAAVRAE